MAYADLLLCAVTYPDVTSDWAIRSGVALARRFSGACTLAALEVDIPKISNRFANALMNCEQIAREQEALSAAAAERVIAVAQTAGEIAGVRIDGISVTARLYEEGEVLCAAAHTRDLCLLPLGSTVLAARGLAEAVLFGSGRPVLVFPDSEEVVVQDAFNAVVIAWDGGRASARAVADALPILQTAGEVRILVATGEKARANHASGADLVRHLANHGVVATLDVEALIGVSAAAGLRTYLAEKPADLLVMGGYGHARLRELVLGGVAEDILSAPPCPVLMAH